MSVNVHAGCSIDGPADLKVNVRTSSYESQGRLVALRQL